MAPVGVAVTVTDAGVSGPEGVGWGFVKPGTLAEGEAEARPINSEETATPTRLSIARRRVIILKLILPPG